MTNFYTKPSIGVVNDKYKLNLTNLWAKELQLGFVGPDYHNVFGYKPRTITKNGGGTLFLNKYNSIYLVTSTYLSGQYDYLAGAPIALGFIPQYEGTNVGVLEINTGSYAKLLVKYNWVSGKNITIVITRYASGSIYDQWETPFEFPLLGTLVNLVVMSPDAGIGTFEPYSPTIYVNGVYSYFELMSYSASGGSDSDALDSYIYLGQTAGTYNIGLKYAYFFSNHLAYSNISDMLASLTKNPMQIFTSQLSIPYMISGGEPPPASADVWRPHSMGFRQPF